MWVQTFHPAHDVFAALKQHDYPAFAASQLTERAQAGLPPSSFQALLRADAKSQNVAQAFLNAAAQALQGQAEHDLVMADVLQQVSLFSAVPMSIQRVANVERAQMLLESPSRMALQKVLASLQPLMHAQRAGPEFKGLIRWLVDVDPLSI
jgi:primosomal protein N' (replication factor Y)